MYSRYSKGRSPQEITASTPPAYEVRFGPWSIGSTRSLMQSIFTRAYPSPCRAYPLWQEMPGLRRGRLRAVTLAVPHSGLLPLAARNNIMHAVLHHDTA